MLGENRVGDMIYLSYIKALATWNQPLNEQSWRLR